jgi:hypothetical protein
MSHFSEGDWVDFVRGLLPMSRDSELRSHIDQQCPECVEALAFWKLLFASVTREAQHEPPEHVLQAAERLYARHKPWRWLTASARWAELVFNSLQQPSPAFVRGQISSDRHLVYKAEPFTIDVTLTADVATNSLLMLGQILSSQNPDQSTNEVHVLVLSGENLIAKTIATESGEFELRCDANADLSLFISIRGERVIGLSLRESTNGEATVR